MSLFLCPGMWIAQVSKVSIVLPVFNAVEHVSLAIASLLLQSHRDLEIIALDDGSTDGTSRILDAAEARDRRVRVVRRPNRGLVATLNEGLYLADADFVARMDADDIAYPARIVSQLEAFVAHPGLGLHGCNFDTIFAPNRATRAVEPSATSGHDLKTLSHFFTILRHPTVMVRRSALPEGALHYDPAYPHAEDFDLFRRIAHVAPVLQGSEPLLAYRLHSGSVSVRHRKTMQASHLRIFEEEMRDHFSDLAGTGIETIVQRIDEETVAVAADLVRRLWTLPDRAPEDDRPALRIAARTLFYFLYAMILNDGSQVLAHAFVESCGRWDMIRRRERLLMRTAGRWPGLAEAGYDLHFRQLGLVRSWNSAPLDRVIPEHARIVALARDLEADARLEAAE